MEAAAGAVDHRANRLEIDIPAPLGDIVGVTDLVTELRAAATNFANSCTSSSVVSNEHIQRTTDSSSFHT